MSAHTLLRYNRKLYLNGALQYTFEKAVSNWTSNSIFFTRDMDARLTDAALTRL